MISALEFYNFQPTDGLKLRSQAVLADLVEDLPKQLSSCLSLTKVGRKQTKYVCHMEVLSEAGVFIEEGKALDPRLAVETTNQKLREQIQGWLSRRLIRHTLTLFSQQV